MSAKLVGPAAAAAAVAAVVVAVPALTSAQSPAPTDVAAVTQFTQKTVSFTEKDGNDFAFLDHAPRTTLGKHGPKKLSNGDQLVFRAFLLNGAKKRVGALDATCMVTGAGNGRFGQFNGTCHGTMTVPGGQLFVAVGGKPFASSTTNGAVTGGTGSYEGAIGGFTSVGENNSKDTIHVWVPVK